MPDRPQPVVPSQVPTAELLARYLAGECTAAEHAAVRRHLADQPELARVVERFARALDGESERPAPPDAAASFAALKRRIAEADAASATAPVEPWRESALVAPPARRVAWKRVVGMGALIAASVVATLWYAGRRAPEPIAPRTYVTAAGQSTVLHLGDGTRVRLAPESRFRVAADFGRGRRDVYLEGEAYFDVAHDTRRPFTVFAGNASARDVGTAFAVRSFAADSAVQVVVRSGAVALSGVGRLGAGDVGRLDADGRASITHAADVDGLLGWVDGRLQYTDAPLGRVLADVHRWYGIDVELADSALAALPFTGVLSGASSTEAVSLVAVTLGLRVQPEGARFVLHPVRGRTPRPRRSGAAAR